MLFFVENSMLTESQLKFTQLVSEQSNAKIFLFPKKEENSLCMIQAQGKIGFRKNLSNFSLWVQYSLLSQAFRNKKLFLKCQDVSEKIYKMEM